jgi:ATP-binding cassette subfamily B (MDR/TAP) protein 1
MSDNIKPHSTDHGTAVADDQPGPKRGLFGGSEKALPEKENGVYVQKANGATPLTAPVSFTTLFRFSTPFELTLNAIGLFAAAAAGNFTAHQ